MLTRGFVVRVRAGPVRGFAAAAGNSEIRVLRYLSTHLTVAEIVPGLVATTT